MSGSRYVLLGLAPARAEWFRTVAQWANAATIPAEFIKCLSAEEVRARLTTGRPFSAVLVDAAIVALDRDFIDGAKACGCPVLVVDHGRRGLDWVALGAAATLPATFDRKSLLDALDGHVAQIARADQVPVLQEPTVEAAWRAPLIAVTGPGGTGASTVAIAVAQGLAADVRTGGAVLLADFRHRAELAMLHDARDMVPGVQELVEACRAGRPSGDDVRALTFRVDERGYHLLLGLRRPHEWPNIRPRAFDAAVDALRTTFRAVVADVGPDVEGEDDVGSIDVEERNTMSRAVLAAADVVVVVTVGGMKGTHAGATIVGGLVRFGVSASRVVPVINRAPRGAGRRTEWRRSLEGLLSDDVASSLQASVFLPERHVDDAFRDGVRLPEAIVAPVVASCRAVLEAPANAQRAAQPRLVRPGTLGRWTPELEAR